MKKLLSVTILCALLLCLFAGCDASLSLRLGDKSTGEGAGMFSSDLSDEERAVCETLI